MLGQSLNARRIHLRESYIAISKYLHFGHTRIPSRHFCCLRDGMRRTRLSTTYPNTFSTLRNLEDRPRLPQDEDITQGFPEPPQSGSVPDASEETGKTHTPGSNRPLEESLPSDSGSDVPVRRILLNDQGSPRSDDSTASVGSQESSIEAQGDHVQRWRYPYMEPFERATHSWEMLQEIVDPGVDETKYPVVLHGYITDTRSPNRWTDYLNFVDPKLRTMVQVTVQKRFYPTQPTTRSNDASATPPANHVAGEAKEESHVQEDAGVLNEARLKKPDSHSHSPTDHRHDGASENDTHLLVKLLAGSDVSTHDQSSLNTADQSDETSSDGHKRDEQIISSHSNTPLCVGYRKFRPHTPVVISGFVCLRKSTTPSQEDAKADGRIIRRMGIHDSETKRQPREYIEPFVGTVESIEWLNIKATSIIALNELPSTLIAKRTTNFPPKKRHLELRTKHHLRHNLRQRSRAMALTRKFMFSKGFDEIETPLLFKSTPEGAREFMVPTRTEGMAYALPQSPQQYKQLLMASGISRYFQFARCFRDEDMRADRQPEFTQLDFEMSFATRTDVMFIVERLLTQILWPSFFGVNPYQMRQKNDPELRDGHIHSKTASLFPRITYQMAMDSFGSDKPDTRLGSKIRKVGRYLPQSLKQMLSPLSSPVLEMIRVDMRGCVPARSREFITKFLEAPAAAPYIQNPAGAPGITVVDPEKPLQGLASFGHEGAETVMRILEPAVGDVLIVQARPAVPHMGSSTPLGNLRRDVHQAAFLKGVLTPPTEDSFLWVVDFPLFSPINDTDPGQGGQAGICSTHHPFTAPVDQHDIDLMAKNPLQCRGDHYDLVINGVEVGGGSRRIHDSNLQERILRDILKMKPERVEDFRHLLNALKVGCPPHAGFALGFDRLMTILTKQKSMRDVIAFPKWGGGEDKMVGAPTLMTEQQLKTYHLRRSTDAE